MIREGKKKSSIYVTRNTAIDALKTTIRENYTHNIIKKIGNDSMILLTAHRRENLGQNMKSMFSAIKRIVDEFEDCNKIHLIEPLEVLDFHNFLNKSYIIMKDSGGIQEEAPSLGKPVLVLRDTKERPEGIATGTLKLAGVDEETIYALTKELLTKKEIYNNMSKASNPYGDGNASTHIVDEIIKKFK